MATRIDWLDRSGRSEGGPDREAVFRQFYEGAGMPCHVGCGGTAEVVRVGTGANGAGELWVECGSCAQRMRYVVPAATELERLRVERALDGGTEPECPRHARRTALQRRGRQFVCPECGVRYRE